MKGYQLKVLFGIMLFFIPLVNILAQDDNKMKFADIRIYHGFQNHSLRPLILDEFRIFTPESEMHKRDLTDFVAPQWFFDSRTVSSTVGINIGFKLFDSDKGDYRNNMVFNIGLIYNDANLYNSRFEKNYRIHSDTYVSPNTGGIIYRDSVYKDFYTMSYNTEQIGVNSNLLLLYNPKGRWSLFGGVGMMASLSINAETRVDYRESFHLNYYHEPNGHVGNNYFFNTNPKMEEIHENKMNVFAMAYVPLGVDFRLGKSNEFWNRIHILMEIQPGIAVYHFPEIGIAFTGTFNGNMGLRVEF